MNSSKERFVHAIRWRMRRLGRELERRTIALRKILDVSGSLRESRVQGLTVRVHELAEQGEVGRAADFLLSRKGLLDRDGRHSWSKWCYYKLGDWETALALVDELSKGPADITHLARGLQEVCRHGPERLVRHRTPIYEPEPGRVLYCAHETPETHSNGYASRTRGLVEAAARAGWKVTCAARPGAVRKSTIDPVEGVEWRVPAGPPNESTRMDWYFQCAVDGIVTEAVRCRAEVIHAATSFIHAYPAYLAARRIGVPFVYEVRGFWDLSRSELIPWWRHTKRAHLDYQFENFLMRESDHLFAITEQAEALARVRSQRQDGTTVVQNGVNPQQFEPILETGSLRRSMGIDEEAFVIGYAGSVVDYEGLETLIEAVAHLIEFGIPAMALIIGDGSGTKSLIRLSEQLGVQDSVMMKGRVAPDEVGRYMAAMDVVACPRSSTDVTNIIAPLKPLESMALGKTTVLSDLPPHQELIQEGGAVSFAAGEASELADKLVELFEDADARKAAGYRSRNWVRRAATWDVRVQSLMDGWTTAVNYHISADKSREIALSDVRMGLISDAFTDATISPNIQAYRVRPSDNPDEVATKIDVLFIESAWQGFAGEWNKGVGRYREQDWQTICHLITTMKRHKIPVIFWNKEDPVHNSRFLPTASLCDVVATTDAASIGKYLADNDTKVVLSLPFFSQPRIHSPFGTSDEVQTNLAKSTKRIAYCGTYYGERYPERTVWLDRFFRAAMKHSLVIYDRQQTLPSTPYPLPLEYRDYCPGGLLYSEVGIIYRHIPFHINVNSVSDSPTMFSRRVVEILASGQSVISPADPAIGNVLGDNAGLRLVPLDAEEELVESLFDRWLGSENDDLSARLHGAHSIVLAHTTQCRLALLLRTAGMPVRRQPVPTVRRAGNSSPTSCRSALTAVEANEVCVRAVGGDTSDRTLEILAQLATEAFEDSRVEVRVSVDAGEPVVIVDGRLEDERPGEGLEQAVIAHLAEPAHGEFGTPHVPTSDMRPDSLPTEVRQRPVVLIAGHDFKFLEGILPHWSESVDVIRDKWNGHDSHDESRSQELLERANYVFCEWLLGNSVWYSKNVPNHVRLTGRLHLQELELPYMANIDATSVSRLAAVARHVSRAAQLIHPHLNGRFRVIGNAVDGSVSPPPSHQGDLNSIRLGLVGILPERKRFDLSIDVVESLLVDHGLEAELHIRSRMPDELPWMAKRRNETSYFGHQFRRIRNSKLLRERIHFHPFGSDMAKWYEQVDVVLSVSDFESFHLTIPDGASHGAIPVIRYWTGADQIYPPHWVFADTRSMVEFIVSLARDSELRNERRREALDWVERLRTDVISSELLAMVLGKTNQVVGDNSVAS